MTMADKRDDLQRLRFDQDPGLRRSLRSSYLRLRNLTNERKDDLMRGDSEKFSVIMEKVDKLHEQVKYPREQVEDAKALQDVINSLVEGVMSHSNGGITPSDFLFCMAEKFGYFKRPLLTNKQEENASYALNWKDIGLFVSPIFMKAHGCFTMNGPTNAEVKKRKSVVGNRRSKPFLTCLPEEISSQGDERTDTDKNMATMFDILKAKKRVRLEALILNRKSFAQTVENLFALSFLVKDGRVEIAVDAKGSHLVSPRNAPAANTKAYNHFVFRFDFQDWKFMIDMVDVGEELMPHRKHKYSIPAALQELPAYGSQTAIPIRRLSRNHGLVVQEEPFPKQSPENDNAGARAANIRRCRRKLFF